MDKAGKGGKADGDCVERDMEGEGVRGVDGGGCVMKYGCERKGGSRREEGEGGCERTGGEGGRKGRAV